MTAIIIYGLQRPDRDIFYVGKTKEPARRLKEHRKRFGREIELIILEVVPLSEWRYAEHAWIQEFRDAGLMIANRTEGGDGIEVMSSEQRADISRRQMGRKHTAEARAKMSAKLKGRRKQWSSEGAARVRENQFKPGNNLWATFSPEETEHHKQRLRDFNKTLSSEERSAAAQKRVAKMNRDAIGERFRNGWAKLTPEERSERNRKAGLAQTTEGRRNGNRAMWEKLNALPPEEKEQFLKDRAAKILASRRQNQTASSK